MEEVEKALDKEQENPNIIGYAPRVGWEDLIFPYWVVQLYMYELDQIYPTYKDRHKERQKISLAGAVNPNPEKYRMVKYEVRA